MTHSRDESLQRRGEVADIPETRFGNWFQSTGVWGRYVLTAAFEELDRLLARPGERFGCVLDVGSGHGLALPLLAERFHPDVLICVDTDPAMIERARLASLSSPCRIDLRVADARQLDLDDGSVDLALCHQTLHHLRRQEQALSELHRVLRPSGVLLLAESCRPFIARPWVRLLFRHPMDVQRSADEFLALLRAAGFDFGPKDIATPDPWWSRAPSVWPPIRRRPLLSHRPHSQLCVVATRPA